MPSVLVFLGGAAIAAAALLIGYYSYVAALVKRELALRAGQERLQAASREHAQKVEAASREYAQKVEALNSATREHAHAVEDFDARKVQYSDLVRENNLLKKDLYNLAVQQKKTERDHAAIEQRQAETDSKMNQLARRHLDENVRVISDKITPNNFASSKKRLQKTIANVREIGFAILDEEEDRLVENLKSEFEAVVRKEFQRQEQARIKAQIREEERLARDIEKKVKEAKREQSVIEAALERALNEAKDEHSAEVEHLRAQLREAQEKAERAMSQAQLTKSGYVYVLSNIGAFGEGVYKIGMTRRLEPMDRVKELGDASVPFPFDVHMLISCDDAPALENALHRQFHHQRLNKVNLRREYFRTDLDSIVKVAQERVGEVEFAAAPEALQYRESLTMTDEDAEYVENVVQSLIDDENGFVAGD